LYVCDGEVAVDVPPSPKVQLKVVVPVEAFVKVTAYGEQPVSEEVENDASGDGLIVKVITVSS
jgi:hypothetical protein